MKSSFAQMRLAGVVRN